MQKINNWSALRAKLARDIDIYLSSQELANSGTHRYALADAGQIPELRGGRDGEQNFTHINLFKRTKEHAIAPYGPLLISLDDGPNPSIIAQLVQGMQHGWTVSWLTSPLSLNELANHLVGHLNGILDDGSEVLIRYYDPRLLPAFLENLDPATKDALLAPVHQWAFWNRKLELILIRGRSLNASPGITETAVSSETQSALASAALADLITSMLLEESDANEFSQWLPHALFNAVVMQIEQAREYGLQTIADLQLFVSLAMRIHPRFHQHLDVFTRESKNLIAGEAGMSDLTLQVPDKEWDRIGAAGVQALQDLHKSINHELLQIPHATTGNCQ